MKKKLTFTCFIYFLALFIGCDFLWHSFHMKAILVKSKTCIRTCTILCCLFFRARKDHRVPQAPKGKPDPRYFRVVFVYFFLPVVTISETLNGKTFNLGSAFVSFFCYHLVNPTRTNKEAVSYVHKIKTFQCTEKTL